MLYLFEDFALDTERRELRRGDTVLSVEPKVFDLLTYVIGNRERVVTGTTCYHPFGPGASSRNRR